MNNFINLTAYALTTHPWLYGYFLPCAYLLLWHAIAMPLWIRYPTSIDYDRMPLLGCNPHVLRDRGPKKIDYLYMLFTSAIPVWNATEALYGTLSLLIACAINAYEGSRLQDFLNEPLH